ncbi:class I SAM-dependent methyltransferase [Candidatus Peribacteria bacterium]|nr:class I SAM-dependent methyltransferase [Candidatus Peribacteria bacterium]
MEKYTSRVIPLSELPKWSRWPARLLNLVEWKVPTRDVAKVDEEYDKNVYLHCVEYFHSHPGATADDVRAQEFRLPRPPVCVSRKNVLYEMPSEHLMTVDNEMLIDLLRPYMKDVDTVIELGCGYGYNLYVLRKEFPGKTYIGGEYSQNAVSLAAELYKGAADLRIEQFNYYDDTYTMFEKLPKTAKVLLFTRHSIEQLPSAKKFVETVMKYADRLVTVLHMEVAFENNGDDLLGMLRKRYVTANDYNRDIVGLLTGRTDIEIVRNDPDEYGENPLNPSSVIVWQPRISVVRS